MPALRWHSRWHSWGAACLLAALLLNAITLAPARHRDDDGADHGHCALCLLQGGAAWTPAYAPVVAPPARRSETAPRTSIEAPPTARACSVPGRGPPQAT